MATERIHLQNKKTKQKKKTKKKIKDHLLRSRKGDEAETLQKCSYHQLAYTKIMFFIAVAHVLSLLWQLKISIDL